MQDLLIHSSWKDLILKQEYGHFSILSKCSWDLNLLQNALKANFKKIKRSKIKKCFTSLINMQSNFKKSKQLQINCAPYTFILLYCLLSFTVSFLPIYISIFLFLSIFSFLSFLVSALLSIYPQKELDLTLHYILISFK